MRTAHSPKHPPNRLSKEKSPYLLQHQYNPVDWYPWGEEAFSKARKENKPIFLSVGYSTCHWCHVMERESFESEAVAKILNDHFVPIKVDREERPDVDKIYMNYVQASTGHGGWPMSVWLTPELKPFVAGTYFPPMSKYGQPGFTDVLLKIVSLWQSRQNDIIENANEIIAQLQQTRGKEEAGEKDDFERGSPLHRNALSKYFALMASKFDSRYGGFEKQPKFPRPVVFTGLFHVYAQEKNVAEGQRALEMVEFTLKEMYKGGMHDHIGGGFHRYSVDKYWHVPHFEKMLYDQGQLANSYLTAYQITRQPLYAEAARDILHYVETKLLSPEGGFYSAEDADSLENAQSTHKAEGAFYVWTKAEIDALLGNDAPLFEYHFSVQENGNAPAGSDPHNEFLGKNILHQKHDLKETAQHFKMDEQEARERLESCKQILYQEREKRPKPFLDDKIIVAWNGLMISAFARASRILDDPHFAQLAERATAFIRSTLYHDGHLIRNFREGRSEVKGFADDYAFLITALLDLYEATGSISHLQWALELQARMDAEFWDSKQGGYFSAAEGDPSLVLRLKEEYDGAEPSPNSFAVMNLLRLEAMTHKDEYRQRARLTMALWREELEKMPLIFPHMLSALDLYFSTPKQIVIAGPPNREDTRAMIAKIFATFDPYRVLLYADGAEGQRFLRQQLGLEFISEASMEQDGKATCYVCKNFTCQLPTTDLNLLDSLLRQ